MILPISVDKNSSSLDPKVWSEQQHQEELFRWAEQEIKKGRSSLLLLGSIPNGIRMLRWNAMRNYRTMGFRKGMPDIYFLRPLGRWHGLFIELKSRKQTSKASKVQQRMLGLLYENGYQTSICHGYEEAIRVINDYEGIKY
jgi:hypothetical protein